MHFHESLKAIDLASILSSRICHDLISPVGAINNALELYEDGAGQEAVELMQMAAASASARLQYARIAYGASGQYGATLDSQTLKQLSEQFMANEKPSLHWHAQPCQLDKLPAKLLLNMILVANSAIPRGGDLVVDIQLEPTLQFKIGASGRYLRLPEGFKTLGQSQSLPTLDAHNIQYYYTWALAKEANLALSFEEEEAQICLYAQA